MSTYIKASKDAAIITKALMKFMEGRKYDKFIEIEAEIEYVIFRELNTIYSKKETQSKVRKPRKPTHIKEN